MYYVYMNVDECLCFLRKCTSSMQSLEVLLPLVTAEVHVVQCSLNVPLTHHVVPAECLRS
jgi:hypothetical protein